MLTDLEIWIVGFLDDWIVGYVRPRCMKNKRFILLVILLSAASVTRGADGPPTAGVAEKPVTKVKKIGVEEFDKLRLQKTNVVLDVRTEKEFKAGHIPGAVNIDIF